MSEKYDLSEHEKECPKEVKDVLITEIERAEPLKFFVGSIRRSKSIAELNRVINRIFDTADKELVWTGF